MLVRLCQIDFLFSVIHAHAKKLGVLDLFIQKLARRSFLFIIVEKKEHLSHISILKIKSKTSKNMFSTKIPSYY